ncbi:MAG: hypothetical protein R3D80_17585 [Paracoccaceae bacterium]
MRTRFIPREILDRFEAVHWSPPQHGAAVRPLPAPIDVAARMRALWE